MKLGKETNRVSCLECDYSASSKHNVDKHVKRDHLGIRFECKSCDYKTPRQGRLDAHLESKHSELEFPCLTDNCSWIGTSKDSLQTHKLKKHRVYCLKCDYSAASEESVDEHVKRDHLGFECKSCDYKTPRQYRLDTHIESKHLKLEFPCLTDNCSWIGKSKDNLQTHKLNKHIRIIKIKCPECDLISNNRTNLRRHMDSVHRNIKYSCETCKCKYTTTYALRKHECRLSCKSCDYKARWQKELDYHQMTIHTEKFENKEQIHDGNTKVSTEEKIEIVDPLNQYISSWLNRNEYKCKLCSKIFFVENYLLQHFNGVHRNNDIKCKECNLTFKNKATLKTHKSAHANVDSIKCKYCDFISIPNPNPSNDPMIRHLGNSHREKLPFDCSYCPKSFPTYKQRIKHMNCHEEAKSYKCEHCPKAFMIPFKLKAHNDFHITGINLPCSQCLKVFPSERLLKKHKNIHTEKYRQKMKEDRKYMCPVVNCFNKKGFRSEKHLRIHNMAHTGEKPFSCNVCDLATSTIEQLRVHERIHMGEGPEGKPYNCPSCEKSFRASGSLKQHKLLHKEEKECSCPECGKKFRHKYTIRVHMRTHTGERPYACKTEGCPVRCATQSAVSAHARNKHSDEIVERLFTCPDCSLALKTKTALEQHKKRVHDPNRVQNFECTECHKRFFTEWDMKGHTRTHTGEKLFPCGHCEKRYGSSQALQYHINSTHNLTERKHPCEKCTRTFRHFRNLRTHMKSHLRDDSQRVHKCDLCDNSFFTPNTLEYHKQTHSDIRPYPCTFCSRGFKTKTQLTNHMPLHEGKQYACEFCVRKYSKSQDLLAHVRRVHIEVLPFKCQNCFTRFVDSFEIKVHQESCRVKKEDKVEEPKQDIGEDDPDLYGKLLSKLKDQSQKSATKIDESGKLRHICEICNSDFSQVGTLKDHKYKKHNIGPVPSKDSSTEVHNCEQCEFTTNTRKGLIGHSKVHNKVQG